MSFNASQTRAIHHKNGPMLVLAGPGSGKTLVITERTKYLIEECGIDPAQILVITFTKAAATEMKRRFQRKMNRSCPVTFGTFHAVYFAILKHAYNYSADNIAREEQRYQCMREIIAKEHLTYEDETEFITSLLGEISLVKNSGIQIANYYSKNCAETVFRKVYREYHEFLYKNRLIDFDDMLVYCYELLEQRPDICKMWQQQFPYILIDEFQDINRVQYDVMRLLAAPANNLFVVGDDDQSIYGFRGSKPDIMQQFLKDYPDAGQCLLNVNYRSNAAIVEAAGKVIVHNSNRLPKEIQAADKEPAKDAIELKEFAKMSDENETIRDKILAYRNAGIPYREMAVLFRTNTQARSLSSKLMEYNIPFTMKERLPNLYDHWIVQDVLTYVRVAQGNRERGQVLRIINRPKRYVHRNAFTEPYVDFEELKLFYEDKDWMVDRLEQLSYDLSMLAQMRPYAAVNFIRKGIGYDEYIREYADYRGIRADDMLEILDELQEEARSQESFEDWYTYMQDYKEELKEQTQKSLEMQRGKEQEDSVMLMTMHGAKGLEFTCVFIPDANEGVTPHSKSVLNADMEEERRMFYVAMTRAKKHLHIYYLKERFHKEVDISRFVTEIETSEDQNETSPSHPSTTS